MIIATKNNEPREGVRPVRVRHRRHQEWRRRTDAQARVEDVSANRKECCVPAFTTTPHREIGGHD
jgi:hypothetical protein